MKIRAGTAALLALLLAVGAAAEDPPAPPEPSPPPAAAEAPPGAAPPAAPAFRPPAGRAVPPAPGGGGFLVRFNNADIYEVIHTLGRIAEVNYLIDPRVRGVVNVQTQGAVRKEAALELLLSILRINGATAVLEGSIYHIVPANESKAEPLPFAGADKGAGQPSNRHVLRVFPLQFIPAADMAKVIKPFVSAGGEAIEVTRTNMLLVVDTGANMDKHARLVDLFDSDAFRSAGVRLFPVKHVDPEEMAKSIDSIFGALDFSAKGGHPAGLNFVPIPRMSALLVVSASPRTMEDVERWIGELDKESSAVSRTVRLYRVRHGKAKDLMAILEKLYPGRTAAPARETEFRPQVAEPQRPSSFPGVRIETKPPEPRPLEAPVAAASPGKGKEEGFDIILDEPLNALIVRGSAARYAAVLETLREIDVYPRQILLEVLIGEVQLDDALRLGIDWSFKGTVGDYSATGSLTTSAATIAEGGTAGLKYAMAKADRVMAAFRALASDGKVSILSAPSVIGTNGKKSKIEVADSVPIVTASIVANSNPPVTTQTVEYKDVGILLNFTPFINDQGTVTLEIEQEVSDLSDVLKTATSNPSFFKRNIQTTLVATENRSIVLGGLVREKKSLNRDGIPFFYKIPLLGWLFGARADTLARTELLVFITPRVIGSVEEGTLLSREFEERVQELKRKIGETKGMRRGAGEPGTSPGAGAPAPAPGLSPASP